MPDVDPDVARARIEALIEKAEAARADLTPERIDALCREYRSALIWQMLEQRAPRLTWHLPARGET